MSSLLEVPVVGGGGGGGKPNLVISDELIKNNFQYLRSPIHFNFPPYV